MEENFPIPKRDALLSMRLGDEPRCAVPVPKLRAAHFESHDPAGRIAGEAHGCRAGDGGLVHARDLELVGRSGQELPEQPAEVREPQSTFRSGAHEEGSTRCPFVPAGVLFGRPAHALACGHELKRDGHGSLARWAPKHALLPRAFEEQWLRAAQALHSNLRAVDAALDLLIADAERRNVQMPREQVALLMELETRHLPAAAMRVPPPVAIELYVLWCPAHQQARKSPEPEAILHVPLQGKVGVRWLNA